VILSCLCLTYAYFLFVIFQVQYFQKLLAKKRRSELTNAQIFGEAASVVLHEEITFFYCWGGKREDKLNLKVTELGECLNGMYHCTQLYLTKYIHYGAYNS